MSEYNCRGSDFDSVFRDDELLTPSEASPASACSDLVESIRLKLKDDSAIARAVMDWPNHHNMETSPVVSFLRLREQVEELINQNNRSFHVNSFYSPDVTFGEMAVKFLTGRDLFGLQDYFNGYLALPWQEMSVNLRDDRILEARDMSYRRGQIPCRGGRLSLFADPGEKRTHWVAALIMADGELIVIDWGAVLKIEDLREIAAKAWPLQNEPGKALRAVNGFIDSGDFTMRVYDFSLRSAGFWHPTKGVEGQLGGSPWNLTRVKSHPGLMLTTYSDFQAKNELYEHRLHRRFPPPVRLPGDMSADLLQGLSGQQKLEKRTPRGVMRFWKRLPEDHLGDCVKLGVISSWVERSWSTGDVDGMQ